MDTALITAEFAKMGARVRFGPQISQRENHRPAAEDRSLRVDIQKDQQGEYFDVRGDDSVVDLEVVDLNPEDRHLLLLARRIEQGQQHKFLCGHDERHWFVAAVPDVPGISNIRTAQEALRSDLRKRILSLGERFLNILLVEECVDPAEQTAQLLEEFDRVADGFDKAIFPASIANIDTTIEDGLTLTEALAVRDELEYRRSAFGPAIQQALWPHGDSLDKYR